MLFPLVPNAPVQNVNVSVVSSEEAFITWIDPDITDQNGIITDYVINVTRVSTGESFQMTSTTTDVFLSDLVPFSSYVCRVAARTTIGAGPYSMATSFLTMETGMLRNWKDLHNY